MLMIYLLCKLSSALTTSSKLHSLHIQVSIFPAITNSERIIEPSVFITAHNSIHRVIRQGSSFQGVTYEIIRTYSKTFTHCPMQNGVVSWTFLRYQKINRSVRNGTENRSVELALTDGWHLGRDGKKWCVSTRFPIQLQCPLLVTYTVELCSDIYWAPAVCQGLWVTPQIQKLMTQSLI